MESFRLLFPLLLARYLWIYWRCQHICFAAECWTVFNVSFENLFVVCVCAFSLFRSFCCFWHFFFVELVIGLMIQSKSKYTYRKGLKAPNSPTQQTRKNEKRKLITIQFVKWVKFVFIIPLNVMTYRCLYIETLIFYTRFNFDEQN